MMDRVWVPRPKTGETLYDCHICGRTLYDDEYEKHMVRCAKDHHEVLVELGNRVACKLPKAPDPEYEAWVRRYAQEIIEDRKKM